MPVKTISKAEARIDNPLAKPTGKRFVKLPDGSFVILNENSELDYPDQFDGKTREVTLRGEAYFDIKHINSKAFIVHTGDISTTVLGTAFDIKAFPDQNDVVVTVTRGKVKIADKKKIYAVITPNQQVSINKENNQVAQLQVDAESVVAWKKLYLVLSDITLEDAALLIGNKYHVRITIPDEKLKKCMITVKFFLLKL
jgi:transmembrane sensor